MLEKKSKEELIELVKQLEENIGKLENDVDYWQDQYNHLEIEIDNLNSQLDELETSNGIKDVDYFKRRLKIDNLYTDELEEFIENYLRFYNN